MFLVCVLFFWTTIEYTVNILEKCEQNGKTCDLSLNRGKLSKNYAFQASIASQSHFSQASKPSPVFADTKNTFASGLR